GLADLLLGKGGAARHIVLGLLLRFRNQQARLALGGVDDVGGLLLGFLALALVLGQQLLGLLAQAPGFVQLAPDALGAIVERLRDHGRRLHVEDDRRENDETD